MDKKKPCKVAENKSDTIREVPAACTNEDAAVEFIEKRRWRDNPTCPHCQSANVYKMTGRDGEREKNYRWRCRDCAKLYTVRFGTVFAETRIPLRHWCFAFWAACASKKGVSAKQIQRQTGLSYKSALFLLHRVRLAMSPADAPKLSGIVECDETWIGGRPRRPGVPKKKRDPHASRRKAIYERKQPVFAAVQRDGQARVRVIPRVNIANLQEAVLAHVELSSRLMTDENFGYFNVGRKFKGGHDTIAHKNRIYARGDITTNTVEGFFAILKRGIMGTYHSVSREHLQRYLDEFEFRYNTRKMDDGERLDICIRQAEGKRMVRGQADNASMNANHPRGIRSCAASSTNPD